MTEKKWYNFLVSVIVITIAIDSMLLLTVFLKSRKIQHMHTKLETQPRQEGYPPNIASQETGKNNPIMKCATDRLSSSIDLEDKQPDIASLTVSALRQKALKEGLEAARNGRDSLYAFYSDVNPLNQQLFDLIDQECKRLTALRAEQHSPEHIEKMKQEMKKREEERDTVYEYIQNIDTSQLNERANNLLTTYKLELETFRAIYSDDSIDYKIKKKQLDRLSSLGTGLYLELRSLFVKPGYYDDQKQGHAFGQALLDLSY